VAAKRHQEKFQQLRQQQGQGDAAGKGQGPTLQCTLHEVLPEKRCWKLAQLCNKVPIFI